MNKIMLMGRLTRDPEIKETTNGSKVCRYSIAVNRKYQKNQEAKTDYFNITSFGKAGEFAANYFTKGMKVLITGTAQNNTYTNRDGVTVHEMQIIAEEQEFVESKKNKTDNDAEMMDIPEEEIPFM